MLHTTGVMCLVPTDSLAPRLQNSNARIFKVNIDNLQVGQFAGG
jgi:hypothetical protein